MNQTLGLMPLGRALISTFDKTGLVPLCKQLVDSGVEVISTGNTARYLRSNEIPVTDVEEITHFPEILQGRVKTLHPHIFSGILARRHLSTDLETLKLHEIDMIDLVIVNLYPFEKTVLSPGATFSDCIENIDIGGPSLLRAAAKNHEYVSVLCDPSQYSDFLTQYETHQGTLLSDRRVWASAAFAHTMQYDHAIATWMGAKSLRYGENPHQKASLLVSDRNEIALAGTLPIQGKELSYNNLLDAHAAVLAIRCLCSTKRQIGEGCVIIKHGTPCGSAKSHDLFSAVERALASDPSSAFGGIVAVSHEVDAACATVLKSHFLEVIVAPRFSEDALKVLKEKKDLRLLAIPELMTGNWPSHSTRSIFGGLLIQDFDSPDSLTSQTEVVSKRNPSEQELRDLEIAHLLAIPCLSNAITIVREGQLIGVGAGQTSRVDAVKLAIAKARAHGHSLHGASLASDGFFPFADSLIVAHDAGISSVIQPGGSKRDAEVIEKANELNLSMVFSHQRHFRH